MITKDILNTDISYNGVGYHELSDLIDRWKHLLVSKSAVVGDRLALSILSVSINHIALIFAAGELGMRLFIIDSPVAITTVNKTKLALFGPVEFTVECDMLRSSELHHLMVKKYSKVVIAESDIQFVTERYTPSVAAPDLPYLIASTSGTTADSKPVTFSQQEVFLLSKRNIDVFRFYKHSRVAHSRNMHHASSLLTDILPSLMASDFHIEAYHAHKEFAQKVAPDIRNHRIDRVLVKNHWNLKEFLEGLGEGNQTTILINISGFTVPEYFIDLCAKYNVEFLSHFGSIDTGIPLLVNHVTANSKFSHDSLGVVADEFYQLTAEAEQTWVACPTLWGQHRRQLQDKLIYTGTEWLHAGRAEPVDAHADTRLTLKGDYTIVRDGPKSYLAAWEAIPDIHKVFDQFDIIGYLDKHIFTSETKVNMDQLRAHFRSIDQKDIKMYSVKLEFSLDRNPFAILHHDSVQNLINLSNNSNDISHFYGVLLNRHQLKRQYFIVMSYNKQSLHRFIETDGQYLLEMYRLLLNSGYSPRLSYNNE
jgi:hypothetical protein